jgi:hypothetical protein
MQRSDRRTALRIVGAGLGTSVAGCLSDGPGGTPTDRDDTTSTGTPTATRHGGLAYDVTSFGTSLGRPRWYGDDETAGHVQLFATEAAARGVLDLDEVGDDRRDGVESFVADTDFATERLLYVVSVGPDTCHGSIEVGSLSVEGEQLVGRARAVDTSDENEGCGDAITYPSALVRATFEGTPRDRVRFTVTDGWDQQTEVTGVAVATDPRTLSGHVRPDADPVVHDELVCDDPGFSRHGEGFSARPPWGFSSDSWGAFALRVDQQAVERGDDLAVSMTNVGALDGHAGNRHKYNLQVRTEAGWQDVRGTTDDDPVGYTDEAHVHSPGEGFEWTLTMTPDGLLEGHVHEDRLSVCPGLPAGRYRFVFWEPTVAVAFDLVD